MIQVGVVCGEHLNPAPPARHRFQEVGCRGGFAVAAHQKQGPAPGLVGYLAQLLVQEARLPGAGSAELGDHLPEYGGPGLHVAPGQGEGLAVTVVQEPGMEAGLADSLQRLLLRLEDGPHRVPGHGRE